MESEVLFQRDGMGFESAGGTDIIPPLHSVESFVAVGGEVTLDAGQADSRQLRQGRLRQVGLGGEPEQLHPFLNLRTEMVVAVVGDTFEIVRCQRKLGHGFLPNG